jgi:hypothetical protein
MELQELADELKIKRFVVWGLRTVFNDSHHFIHRGFFVTLTKLGVNVIWVDDSIASSALIGPGDFVIAVNRAMKYLPFIQGCKYCLHNAKFSDDESVNAKDIIYLQVLTKDRIDKSLKNTCNVNALLEGSAYFDRSVNILYQSWGTPLLASEFLKPKKLNFRKYEFFVGAIWNNDLGQGNDKVIPQYERILKDNSIKFVHVQGAPEVLNPSFVRHSAIGASIVGEWQQHWGYAPCRLFKAISYGIPGLINSSALLEAYPWVRADEDISRLVSYSLELKPHDAEDLVHYQQSFISKETYESKLKNILICLNSIDS